MGIRILVADDDPDIVLGLSERLRWMGHDVVSASDGQAALNAVESHALDLAFLDVAMPRLNGIDALKRIRQRWPDLPVVVVTAGGTIRLAVEAMKYGAVDFIAKPFEPGQIDLVVTNVMQRNMQRTEVTQLMGEITHDVKNLLMPLVTGTDLLAEEINDLFKILPEAEISKTERSHQACDEVIRMLRNTSQRIQDRMKAIADYAALTRVPQKFESCQVGKVADAVVKSLRVLAEQKKVVVRTEGLQSLPAIMADNARLYSLLFNLVHNAIPETPPNGSVTITGAHRSGADYIELAVRDTGKGMPSDVRDTLFTTRSITTKAGGTGLGTKIAKDVVDMHGGQITVESEPDRGTTFHIRLPIDRPAFLHQAEKPAQQPAQYAC